MNTRRNNYWLELTEYQMRYLRRKLHKWGREQRRLSAKNYKDEFDPNGHFYKHVMLEGISRYISYLLMEPYEDD